MSYREQHEKRTEERVFTALPVDLGDATGVTRDVSASGMFFEMDSKHRLGSTMEFAVEMDTPGGKMLLKCEGEVVRIEPRGPRVGVAVRITQSSLEMLRKK